MKKKKRVNRRRTSRIRSREQSDPNLFVIDEHASNATIRRAAHALDAFFLDSLAKHHPGQEDEWP